MNISIYTIIKELDYKIELIQSDANSYEIQEVCMASESLIPKVPEQNTLYIIGKNKQRLFNKYPFSHVILMEMPVNLPAFIHTCAVVKDSVSIGMLTQKIQLILNHYHRWYQQIITEMNLYQSPQDIIELCESLFPYPFAFFDTTQAMLYKTSTLKDKTKNQLWDYAIDTGFSPDESYDIRLFRLIAENEKPFLYKSQNQYRDYYRLIAPIKSNQSVLGYLVTNLKDITFTEDEISAFYYIQQVFSLGLKYFKRLDSVEDSLPWYYEKLLSGEYLETNILTNCVHMTGHETDEPFMIWLFRKEEAVPIKKAILHLRSFFKGTPIKTFLHFIIIIDYKIDLHSEPSFLNSIRSMLKDTRYSCGISQVFTDISELYHAYQQASIALNFSKMDIQQAENVLSQYAMGILSQNQDISVFLHPCIVKLYRSKKNVDNYLLLTLQTYLFHGQNISLTAKKLFIHRHTATYRMELISEITGLDFADCSNEVLMQILFSCEYFLRVFED